MQVNSEKLETVKHHLEEAIRYMEFGEPSCFPGFDCGLIELQLTLQEIENLEKESNRQ